MVPCHFSLSYRWERLTAAAQLIIVAGFDTFSALTSSSFPSLTDFSAAATADALKWMDLEKNVVYQIMSTRTVNTQHGQSVIPSLQKDGGSSFSVWACGMLVSSRLFVLSTGKKTSKIDRDYNLYQLLQC